MKYLYGISAPIMKEVFRRIVFITFEAVTLLTNPKTKKYSTDTVAYKADQIWSMLPGRDKISPSLDLLKSEIKNWHCSDCPCNIY